MEPIIQLYLRFPKVSRFGPGAYGDFVYTGKHGEFYVYEGHGFTPEEFNQIPYNVWEEGRYPDRPQVHVEILLPVPEETEPQEIPKAPEPPEEKEAPDLEKQRAFSKGMFPFRRPINQALMPED